MDTQTGLCLCDHKPKRLVLLRGGPKGILHDCVMVDTDGYVN